MSALTSYYWGELAVAAGTFFVVLVMIGAVLAWLFDRNRGGSVRRRK
jgi:hypothetical protein